MAEDTVTTTGIARHGDDPLGKKSAEEIAKNELDAALVDDDR
jgi:hypothetical protein